MKIRNFRRKIRLFFRRFVPIGICICILLLNLVIPVSAESSGSTGYIRYLGYNYSLTVNPNFNDHYFAEGEGSLVTQSFDKSGNTLCVYYQIDVPHNVGGSLRFFFRSVVGSGSTFSPVIEAHFERNGGFSLVSPTSVTSNVYQYDIPLSGFSGLVGFSLNVSSASASDIVRLFANAFVLDSSGDLLQMINSSVGSFLDYWLSDRSLYPVDTFYASYTAPKGVFLTGSSLSCRINLNGVSSGNLSYFLYTADGSLPDKFKTSQNGTLYYYDDTGRLKSLTMVSGSYVSLPDDFFGLAFLNWRVSLTSSLDQSSVVWLYDLHFGDDGVDSTTSAADSANSSTKSAINSHDSAEQSVKSSASSVGGKSHSASLSGTISSSSDTISHFGSALGGVTMFLNGFFNNFLPLKTILLWSLVLGLIPLIFGSSMHGMSSYRVGKDRGVSRRDREVAKKKSEVSSRIGFRGD